MHPFFGSAQQLCPSHLSQATLKVVSMLIEPNPTHAQKKTTRNSKASSSTHPPSVGTMFSSLKACQLQHVSCIVRKTIRGSQPQAVSPATSTGPISSRGRMLWVAAPQRTKKVSCTYSSVQACVRPRSRPTVRLQFACQSRKESVTISSVPFRWCSSTWRATVS